MPWPFPGNMIISAQYPSLCPVKYQPLGSSGLDHTPRFSGEDTIWLTSPEGSIPEDWPLKARDISSRYLARSAGVVHSPSGAISAMVFHLPGSVSPLTL